MCLKPRPVEHCHVASVCMLLDFALSLSSWVWPLIRLSVCLFVCFGMPCDQASVAVCMLYLSFLCSAHMHAAYVLHGIAHTRGVCQQLCSLSFCRGMAKQAPSQKGLWLFCPTILLRSKPNEGLCSLCFVLWRMQTLFHAPEGCLSLVGTAHRHFPFATCITPFACALQLLPACA